jgi:drug/metabolite transporter (DMT)-like permease
LFVAGLIGSLVISDLQVSARDAAIGLAAGSLLLAIPGWFFNMAARVVPAPESALLLMSEIVLAPVWVWIFVDERPEPTTLIGGSIILAAVVGLLLWRRQQMSIATGQPIPVTGHYRDGNE